MLGTGGSCRHTTLGEDQKEKLGEKERGAGSRQGTLWEMPQRDFAGI